MRFTRIATLFFVLCSSLLAAPNADATLIPSPDGRTVYDTFLKVNWLANANLAGPPERQLFGVNNITPGGSMNYSTAVKWVAGMNNFINLDKSLGYLGHTDWQLPTTPGGPNGDTSCSSTGPLPYQNSFGFGCRHSDLGSLYYRSSSLGLHNPNTAVPIPNNIVGPFSNFQPYLYWTETIGSGNSGFHTFSFNTGWAGSNVDGHYMYVLPMIKGNPFGTPVNGPGLQVSADGKTIYDPDAVYDLTTGAKGVTWLADADLAKTRKFGAQCANPDGTKCINKDGSMTNTTAQGIGGWIAGMNAHKGVGWLHQKNWQLPPDPVPADPTMNPCGGFDCSDTPLGHLYYIQLGLKTTHIHTLQGVPISLEVTLNAFDNLSGVATTEYSLDRGATWRIGKIVFLCGGTRTLQFRSTDVAGNVEKRKSITVNAPACN